MKSPRSRRTKTLAEKHNLQMEKQPSLELVRFISEKYGGV